MSTNEAAERPAVDLMMEWINAAPKGSRKELGYLFGAALAAERRATVERIRERLILPETTDDNQPFVKGDRDFIDAILDEVRDAR